jgi:hypothetical protein
MNLDVKKFPHDDPQRSLDEIHVDIFIGLRADNG